MDQTVDAKVDATLDAKRGAKVDATGIGFHLAECSLGILGVAATARGVCHIRFGDDPREVEAALRAEFPWAELRQEPERLAPHIDALKRHLSGETRELELPLDVRGSQFQRRVWDAIAAVPYGSTRAYADLAADIGQPQAARAVAQACGANPVAIAVACHRIVGRRGALGGYRYGVERKRRLLARESGVKLGSPHGRADRLRGTRVPGTAGAGGVARPHAP
jgi:AraC family transcriptional regulator of adaptative response/methylated-DNA-[protein]-cysteine methyltransferase